MSNYLYFSNRDLLASLASHNNHADLLCASCKLHGKKKYQRLENEEQRLSSFWVCLTCWAAKYLHGAQFQNESGHRTSAPIMLCDDCADERTVCHPWDHIFLCADASAEYANTPVADLISKPQWRSLEGAAVETVLKKIGLDLRGVKGKVHDEACTSCSRAIVGMRFSRVSNYENQSFLTTAYGVENLCQECFITKRERGDSAKRGAHVDPYWIVIPSLWQFGDSDIGEMMQGSAVRNSKVVEGDAPYQPALRASDYTPTKESVTSSVVPPATYSNNAEPTSGEMKPADDYTDQSGSFETSSYTAYAATSAHSSYQAFDDTPSSAYAMDPATYAKQETSYQAFADKDDTPYQQAETSYKAFDSADKPYEAASSYQAYPEVASTSTKKAAAAPTTYAAYDHEAVAPNLSEPSSSYQAYAPDGGPAPDLSSATQAYAAYTSAPKASSSAPASYTATPTSYSSSSASSVAPPAGYSSSVSAPVDPYFGNRAPSTTSESALSQASSVSAPVAYIRSWNDEFQRLFDAKPTESAALEERVLHMQSLQALSRDFISTAERIGKIIIDEVHVPATSKSIKPANMGGVAGGEKYLVEGIFFKFAIDAFGVYGGDDFAMKAAGHELNGLKAYHAVSHLLDAPGGHGLHFPFMVLISFRGYRLIATPKLPLGPGSLIYGSADAGKTVHRSNDGMNDLMKQAAKILNIKEHGVGLGGDPNSDDSVVMLDAPTDIEGHMGGDGRYYLLDTARICPPEPPRRAFMAVKIVADDFGGSAWAALPRISTVELNTSVWKRQLQSILLDDPALNGERVNIESRDFLEGTLYYLQQTQKVVSMLPVNSRASTLVEVTIHGDAVLVVRGRKGAFLYNLMPYELVKAYGGAKGIALSSDAFTQFGRHKSAVHNEEVFDCFYWLLGEHIPKFVKEVLNENRPLSQSDLVPRMHSWGINLRLLGFVRALFRTPPANAPITEKTLLATARSVLLVEMIARTSKSYIRSRVRSVKTLDESIRLVVQHFNVLFGRSRASTFFWHTFVKIQLAAKYDVYGPACLTEEELSPSYDLRDSLSLLMLFQLLKADVGVEFSVDCQETYEKSPHLFGTIYAPFHRVDVVGFTVMTRHLLEDSLKASTNELVLRYVQEKAVKPGSMEELKLLKEFLGASPIEYSYHFLKRAYEAKRAGKFDESVEADTNLALEPFVDAPATCPYEIAVKSFFIKGYLAEMRGDFGQAEAFYRAVYDALVNVHSQPDGHIQNDYALVGYVPLETNSFFALVVLEQWIGLCVKAGRMIEGYILSCKFAKLNLLLAAPDYPEEVARAFDRAGQSPSLALSLFSQSFAQFKDRGPLHEVPTTQYYFPQIDRDDSASHKAKGVATTLTQSMNLDPTSARYRQVIASWHDKVHLGNPSNWSGFTLSPMVLDEDVQLIYNSSPRPVYGYVGGHYELNRRTGCLFIHPEKTVLELSDEGTISTLIQVHIPGRRMRHDDYSGLEPYHLLLVRKDLPSAFSTLSNIRGVDYNEAKKFTCFVSKPLHPQNFTASRWDIQITNLKLRPGIYVAALSRDNNAGIGRTGFEMSSTELRVVSGEQKKKSYVLFHNLIDDSAHYETLFDDRRLSAFAFSVPPPETPNKDGKFDINILVATDDGKVYEFGREDNGKKAGGYRNFMKTMCWRSSYSVEAVTDKDTFFELRQLSAYRISDLSASGTHFLAVTQTKELLAWGGNNKHGPLGQGDSDSRLQPRLIEKLKGVKIEKAFAFNDRSFAIDQSGLLYQWGKGFGLFPQSSKYFQAEDVQSIVQVAVCDYEQYVSYATSAVEKNAFPDETVFYLTRLGEVYWSNQKHPKPTKLIATYDLFVVQIAAGAGHLLALTEDGQIYGVCDFDDIPNPNPKSLPSPNKPSPNKPSPNKLFRPKPYSRSLFCGLWRDGQFANFPNFNGQYSNLSSEGIPMSATKVGTPPGLKFVQIGAVGYTSCALDEEGRLWYWGNGHYVPLRPVSLRDHTVTKFALDGMGLMVVCGRRPDSIEVDPKSLLLRNEKRVIVGREDIHRVEAHQDERTGAVTLEWHRPPGDVFRKEVLEFVHPEKDSFPDDSGMRGVFAMRSEVPQDTSKHTGKIVLEYNTKDADKAIKLPDGDYQVIYWGGEDNWGQNKRVLARTKTFHLTDGGGYELSAPAEVEPQKPFKVHFKIPRLLGGYAEPFYRITAMDKKGTIYHQHYFESGKAVNQGTYELTLYIAGDYDIIMGLLTNDDNNVMTHLTKISVRAEVKLDLFSPEEIDLKSTHDLSAVEKGSKFPVEYSFAANSPHKLTQYNEWFGVWKPEAAESSWPPQFGFPGMIAHELPQGTYDATAPSAVGEYEIRILSINAGNYKVLKRLPFTVVAEKPKPPPAPAPAPSSTPASSSAIYLAPVALESIKVPSYSDWEELLKATAIPSMFHAAYKMVFSAQNIPIEKLKAIDYPFLSSMGIAMPAHQLEIMTKIQEVKEAEQKKFIQEEISRQMSALRK